MCEPMKPALPVNKILLIKFNDFEVGKGISVAGVRMYESLQVGAAITDVATKARRLLRRASAL